MRREPRLLVGALSMMAFRCSTGGMPILVGLLIAARWGLRSAGAYAVANAAVTVTMAVADWGATRALPRNLAAFAGDDGPRFLTRSNAVRAALAGAAILLILLAGVAASVAAEAMLDYALLLPLVPLVLLTNNAVSARVVSGHVAALGGAALAGSATFALLATASVAIDVGPQAIVGAVVLGKVVEAVALASGRWWVSEVRPEAMRATFLALSPFGIQILFGALYSRLPVFTLERLGTSTSLGVLFVAMALQSVLLLVPSSLGMLQFAALTRLAARRDLQAMRRGLLRYVVAGCGSVIAGLVVILALVRPIGEALHVPGPLQSFLVAFSALALFGVFSGMSGFLLQAWAQEGRAARLSLITLLLALCYEVTAVAAWGLWGVIAGVAAAEITSILIFGLAVRRSWILGAGEQRGRSQVEPIVCEAGDSPVVDGLATGGVLAALSAGISEE